MSRPVRVRTLLAATGIAVAIAMTGAGAQALPATSPPAAEAASTAVDAWITTRGNATPTEAKLPFKSPSAQGPLVVGIEPQVRFQQVSGFGAAITDSSAHVLYWLSPQDRDEAMRKLFDPVNGAGINFLRQPIGASDFVVDKAYSYDDMPAGQKDYALRHFSIAHDEAQILPLLRQAKKLNPALKIVASPWSPPGWMKDSDSMIDGKVIDSPAIYRAYAGYLVKFVQAYRKAGVKVDYLTVQNEPQALRREDYPGTDLPWWQQAKIVDYLGPALRSAGLDTKILGFDHNWGLHPGDVKSYQLVNEDPMLSYPYDLMSTGAARWMSGTAYHCYYGDASAQTALKASFPGKDVLMTECEGAWVETFLSVLQNWGTGAIAWNIALDQNHGPHVGGCGTCNGTITINSETKAVTYNDQYRDIAHFSKFVPAGSVRIASTFRDTTYGPDPVRTVAFTRPDRKTVVVAWNQGKTPKTFTVVSGDRAFDSTLAPGAVATYTWR